MLQQYQSNIFFSSIIVTAFFASAMIFVCFSLCALLAEDRSFLYIGGQLYAIVCLRYELLRDAAFQE